MKKSTLILEGLDCANCAGKIVDKLNKQEQLSNVNFNFMNKKLDFITDIDEKDFIKIVTNVVDSIEDGVTVKKISNHVQHEHDENNNYTKIIVRIILSAIFFVTSLIIKDKNMILVFSLISYVIIGYDIILSAIAKIFKGKALDETFLMSIASIGAFVLGEFTEGVAVMLFYQIGELCQDIAVHKSRRSITELLKIRPDYANLKKDNNVLRVSPEEVGINDIIVVKAGEKVPLDGKVISGAASLDTSALTGESMYKDVDVGDDILSGSINLNGVIEVCVESKYENSTVSRIIELAQNAGSKKAKVEKFVTRFAKVYTPIVVLIAVILAVFPPLILQGAEFSTWIYRALIFLVISCPCALVISVPLGFFGGIGGASRSGILIKGANSLESLSKVGTVAFDKTGTLTKGEFSIVDIKPVSINQQEFLNIVSSVESFSNHPVAKAIVNGNNINVNKDDVDDFNEIIGKGIIADYKGDKLVVGNEKLFIENGIQFNKQSEDKTIVYVAINGKYEGFIELEDTLKKGSKSAIQKIKKLGLKSLVMLTGDKKATAEKIAKKIAIDKVYSELLPEDKVFAIEKIIEDSDKLVAFVGDGINDAPVLARADVGIAMGGLGSDSAIEVADVVIMNDEPEKVATAIKISKYTMSIIKQNIIFALSVKFLILAFGIFGFVSMWLAVFADVGVSLIAILNSLRAMKKQK